MSAQLSHSNSVSSSQSDPHQDQKAFIEFIGAGEKSAFDQTSIKPFLAGQYLPDDNPHVQLLFLTKLSHEEQKFPVTKEFFDTCQIKLPRQKTVPCIRKGFAASTVIYVLSPFIPLIFLATLKIDQIGLGILLGCVVAACLVSANTVNYFAFDRIRKDQPDFSTAMALTFQVLRMKAHFDNMGLALLELNRKPKTRQHVQLFKELSYERISSGIQRVMASKGAARYILSDFEDGLACINFDAEPKNLLHRLFMLNVSTTRQQPLQLTSKKTVAHEPDSDESSDVSGDSRIEMDGDTGKEKSS